jgi:hypothetical protein
MNSLLRIAVCALCLLPAGIALAGNPNIGTAGAQFLQIPVGARATAMGGAVVGHIDDATSLFWNPAGIVGVPSGSLFAGYTSWWASVGLSHAAFVYSVDEVGSFGVSATMLGMDPMDVTTELAPDGTGETFEARDLMVGISFARRLTEDFSVGVTAKYVYQSIWRESASGIAFDVGTQYRIGIGDLTLAMAMTNFGGDMQMDGQDLEVKVDGSSSVPNNRLAPARLESEAYPLPLHFQVGISMTVLDLEDVGVLLAVDVTHPNDTRERVNLGSEVRLLQYLFLRGGYRINYDIESGTMGAGIRVPVGDLRVDFDYAYALYDQLPDIHRISLGVDF